MNKLGGFFKTCLDKLGFLDNEKERVSLTNLSVIVFASIVAFRTLFSGLTITESHATWVVKDIDVPSTLSFLYSLWNYTEKRKQIPLIISAQNKVDTSNDKNV